MLQLRDVHTFYGASHVLHGVSLDVESGSIVGVVGRNGMGKTTLIRSITALTPPRAGSIRFHGQELRGLPPHVIAHLGIGLVPQGRRVFPSLTVEENLTAAARGPGYWRSMRCTVSLSASASAAYIERVNSREESSKCWPSGAPS